MGKKTTKTSKTKKTQDVDTFGDVWTTCTCAECNPKPAEPTWTSTAGKISIVNDMSSKYIVNVLRKGLAGMPFDKIDEFKNVLLEAYARDLLVIKIP
jgi:hypothetical protein